MKTGLAAFAAEMFVDRVGEVFRLVPSVAASEETREPFELELVEVTRSRGRTPAAGGAGTREPFALLFALRGRTPLGPSLHRLVDEAFEPEDLLLSRVVVPGRDPRAIYYEAVFG